MHRVDNWVVEAGQVSGVSAARRLITHALEHHPRGAEEEDDGGDGQRKPGVVGRPCCAVEGVRPELGDGLHDSVSGGGGGRGLKARVRVPDYDVRTRAPSYAYSYDSTSRIWHPPF
jgi:hypothetical protein